MDSTRFAGKTVLITGGGSGIGLATAKRIVREGGNVTIVGSTEKRLNDAAEMLKAAASPSRVHSLVADVADEASVESAIESTLGRFGRLDGLFNNAGYEGPLVRIHEYPTSEFERVLNVNLMGTYFGMKYALPVMVKQGSGIVVNNSSVGGVRGFATRSAYSASKHGIIGLSRTAGAEYGKEGVSIVALVPGPFLTPMAEASIRSIAGDETEQFIKSFEGLNPMRRFGEVDEAASIVAFLMSGEARYINGTTITIDGGQTEAFG